MKTRLLICLSLWSLLYATGCLSGTTGKTEPNPAPAEPATPASLADLRLSLAKPSYNLNEPIPLELDDGGREIRSACAVCHSYKQGGILQIGGKK